MDRQTTFTQALGRSSDFLQAQQNAMVALGWAVQASLGTATAVDGFTLTPTVPASLVANLGPGALYQIENLEATTWSSLPANTASILKQGLMQAVDPITFVPPAATGYAQSFLVEAQYADLDTTPVLLPYYNATNPQQPYQGPNNSGVSQSTQRLGIVAIQVKAGVAAPSGSQAIPTPDAGWVGLFVVTLAAGATSVTSGNIAPYAAAPFLPVKLPGVPAGVQSGQWVFGVASGANSYTATLFSTAAYPYVRSVGMEILVSFPTANTTTTPTLAENGQPSAQIRKQGGGAPAADDITGFVPLIWDGTYWRVNGLVLSDIQAPAAPYTGQNLTNGGYYVVDVSQGTNFQLPNPATVPVGWRVRIKAINTPTGFQTSQVSVAAGSATMNLNYGGTAHSPFYLIGNGEGFWFENTGTSYDVLTAAQPGSFGIYASNPGGAASAAGSGSNIYMPISAVSQSVPGAAAAFNRSSTVASLAVPVSGIYQIIAATSIVGQSSTVQQGQLTIADSTAINNAYYNVAAYANQSFPANLSVPILVYLKQGSLLSAVINCPTGQNYVPSAGIFSVFLQRR